MTPRVILTFSEQSQVSQKIAMIQLGEDHERAVTWTTGRMTSFVTALQEVKASGAIGLLITSPSLDSYCVGADIGLIESVTDPEVGANLASQGQAAFNDLEDLGITTVAAISGPCVGGGCEMALACKYRIITDLPGSVIGLPETKLGILPGFGGTYRLPRLVGLPKSLDIILAGKTLRSVQALKAGLVDEVVTPARLLARAKEIAAGVRTPKQRARPLVERILTHTPFGRSFVASRASKALLKQTKGFYPAPPLALATAVNGLGLSRTAALAEEARELGKLIVTPESKSLLHIYHLTESAKAIGKPSRDAVKGMHGIVVGAGVMGAGIAGSLARSGHQVIVKDTSEEALLRGKDHLRKELSKVRHYSSFERAAIASRIDWITHSSKTEARTGIVIEAVFESMELKKKILSSLAPRVKSDCILATNTSSLSVSEIASSVNSPERVVGMHFFNPVEKMPLVEIIRGSKTSDETVSKVAALASALGKFPIVVSDVPGFLVNRILIPYLNEAMYLLLEGHSVEAVDNAALEFGMPMGPVRLLDEVGLDVAAHVSVVMTQGYGSRMTPPPFAEKLMALGRKGRKSGGGFYEHVGKESKPWPGLGNALGLPSSAQSPLTSSQITERLIYHLVNEGMKCLCEGVAGSDSVLATDQIDLGTVMGIGFPPFRGGVMRYAETVGLGIIRERLTAFFELFGERYTPFEENRG